MKYKTIVAISIILFIALQEPTMIASFSGQKATVAPTVTFGNTYQETYNLSNNGLKDFALLKSGFTVNADVKVKTSYDITWNYTKLGVTGVGGIPSYSVLAGTYNFSIFLGLAYLKNVNEPNTIVNGTLNLNLTLTDSSNNNYGPFQMSQVVFSYNNSEISNRIAYFNSLGTMNYPMTLPQQIGHEYYRWDYNNSNVNGGYTAVSEIGRSYTSDFPNGSISMEINESLYGFDIGKIYSNNVSLTPETVPVGYPFSKLKLPSNLTLNEFKDIFLQEFGTLNGFSYDLSAGKLRMNVTAGSFFNYTWVFNQSSGIMMDYSYSASNQYESLHLAYTNITLAVTTKPTTTTTTMTKTSSSSSTATTTPNTSSTNSVQSTKPTSTTPLEGIYSIIAIVILSALLVTRRRK